MVLADVEWLIWDEATGMVYYLEPRWVGLSLVRDGMRFSLSLTTNNEKIPGQFPSHAHASKDQDLSR
jgi:hypothetical protein